ncbi:MAG: hypothetical protein M1485_02015 [Chloroflexi bacterium]|nr:hypothetical protein [Chloroflexota bacterium]
MTIYDDLRKHYGTASAEQKLLVLRRELLRPIVTVQTSSKLLQDIGDEILGCLPEGIEPQEFKNTLQWLSDAARDLQDVLDGLTLDRSQVQEQHGSE